MDIENKAYWLAIEGYNYGDIASVAIAEDLPSFEAAIEFIFAKQEDKNAV